MESRPVQLMNTVRADRSGVHDVLTSPADLARWLADTGLKPAGPAVTADDLHAAVSLRDALRRLAALLTGDTRPAAQSARPDVEAAVAVVNRAAARAPRAALQVSGGGLGRRPPTAPADAGAALAVVAVEAVEVLTGPETVLNASHAPGCVLYFVKDHHRREWCSTACGNRARAARHYLRHRGTP